MEKQQTIDMAKNETRKQINSIKQDINSLNDEIFAHGLQDEFNLDVIFYISFLSSVKTF